MPGKLLLQVLQNLLEPVADAMPLNTMLERTNNNTDDAENASDISFLFAIL